MATKDFPIRILHVIGVLNRGGAETMIMNLYRSIDRTKVQFDFVENEGDEAAFDAEIRQLGGRIYHCPRYKGLNHFAYERWWNDFFKSHRGEYPIVHGHIGSTAAIYLSIAKKYGAYTIAHSHNTNAKTSARNCAYSALSYPTRYIADHFFTCSYAAGVDRFGTKIGSDPSKCKIFHNAIDCQRFLYNQNVRTIVRQQLGIEEKTFVIGNVGRFAPQKNHSFLLDIFIEIKRRSDNAILLLLGDGAIRDEIEEKIKKNSLQDSVILAGVQSEVAPYYQAMDVFVFPSLYEGLPVSLVEAQAAGLHCCVSSNVPSDAAITDLVEFIPLEYGAERWAEIAINRAQEPRENMLHAIQSAGFDVASTAKWLEDFYIGVATNRG